jgi:hypothetical protein
LKIPQSLRLRVSLQPDGQEKLIGHASIIGRWMGPNKRYDEVMARTSQSKTKPPSRRRRTYLHEMPKHPVIDNSEPLSTEEVGEILGVSQERVQELKRFAVEIFDKKKDLQTP